MEKLFQFKNLSKIFILPIVALNRFLTTTAQPFSRAGIKSKKFDLIEAFVRGGGGALGTENY